MTEDWQTQIGALVRETYKKQGYTDITIVIGAIAPDDKIHTQIWTPADSAGDFDIRFMWFEINNHFYSEYNEALDEEGGLEPKYL
jgi:hypothetical protein